MKTRTVKGREVSVHRNDGLRKRCDCPRRAWPKCPHPWHFSFKWAGVHHRFALDDRYCERMPTKKDAARAEADRLRAVIRAGQSPLRHGAPSAVAIEAGALTFDQFTERWRERERAAMKRQQRASDASRCKRLGTLLVSTDQRLGDKPIRAITEDDIEQALVALGAVAASSFNKFRQTLIHLQRWGVKKGYLTRPWATFGKDGPERLKRKPGAKRDRRLVPDRLDKDGRVVEPGEERRLLAAASPWFQRLIIAALESCCRRGELLSLQWADVDLDRGQLRIRAEKSKTGKGRRVPILPRLRSVLDHLQYDPDGKRHAPHAYVFGNAIGEAVADPKKQWETLVLRAYGHTPTWTAGKLSADARAQYNAIDLHFHDLRHEGASRLLEQGWPVHHVQAMLGHADLKTTSIYVNTTEAQLLDTARRFPGPERPALHDVAPTADESVGRTGNAVAPSAANVLVN